MMKKGEREREREGRMGEIGGSLARVGRASPSLSSRRSSLSVNTGYVGRRAGLNWHQLPAKHPRRTFSPPDLPASALLTPARPKAERSTPRGAATILHYENTHPQLTWLWSRDNCIHTALRELLPSCRKSIERRSSIAGSARTKENLVSSIELFISGVTMRVSAFVLSSGRSIIAPFGLPRFKLESVVENVPMARVQ